MYDLNKYFEEKFYTNANISKMISFSCTGYYLESLDGIERCKNITHINVQSNNIKHIRYFPESLISINISSNKLTSIPELPEKLEILNCHSNFLKELPPLPDNLSVVNCSVNELKAISISTNSKIKHLICSYNQITELPILPEYLEELNCNNNLLTNFKNLPTSLKHIYLSNNNFNLDLDMRRPYYRENIHELKTALRIRKISEITKTL